jgi:3',5'-cyclic AMP phosphodiesterase CpdA
MSLLLHLSDLHLGNAPPEDAVGDYKVEAVADKDRVTRLRVLRHTLKALSGWLADNGEKLDGIIITGDVTTRGRPQGFTELPGLLSELGPALPEPTQIVVVPGNHDVAWGTPAGSTERYSAFIDGIRQAGYVTPLLDGIDYDGDRSHTRNCPILSGDDFVVAAINSADMCGIVEPFPADIDAELEHLGNNGLISEGLRHEIQRVRMYDMPRISQRQMAALAELLDLVPPGRVRIAALHHQLAPVREEEEVKPFESIVNVGAFSAFLGDVDIDVIAHGHKHTDHVQTVGLISATGEQRIAVMASCGTIGGTVGTGEEIAKLIRIDSALPTLRRVKILTVPAVGAGRKLRKISSVYDQQSWRPSGTTPIRVISGVTATEVHEQLLDAARGINGKPMRDVICVVDDGATALEPPASYPWPENSTIKLREWFDDIVSWWQDPKLADGKPFTHGQRLHHWQMDRTRDQIEAIIKILSLDATTSRGVAVLVNPGIDDIADRTNEFPSFSLLQLWIKDGALNCTAFFRKQEMTYWWAVNVAEIARIQAHVLAALHPSQEQLTVGAIRTYASEAVFSNRLPKVNVPRLDRQYWQDPDSLRMLAVAVADHTPDRDSDIKTLISLMDDWAPQAEVPPVDGAPVPTRGLTAVASMLAALTVRYPMSPAREISDLLHEIDEANILYLNKRNTGDVSRVYEQWRTAQLRRITHIRELLLQIISSTDTIPADSTRALSP